MAFTDDLVLVTEHNFPMVIALNECEKFFNEI